MKRPDVGVGVPTVNIQLVRLSVSPKRITPEHIRALLPYQVFCFGSNEGGRHSKGAAKTAVQWGAHRSVPAGRSGQTYAIPTKPIDVRIALTLPEIAVYVEVFIVDAQAEPQTQFLMTAIGCGLAGYCAADIAPMFRASVSMANVCLPLSFWLALGFSVPICSVRTAITVAALPSTMPTPPKSASPSADQTLAPSAETSCLASLCLASATVHKRGGS